MHIIKSLQARNITFKSNHYSWFSEGRCLKKLKNIHRGQRCFIVGNGPSLSAEDLTVLYKNNEITFAFNRIYNIFDKTVWRPTYYISQDEKMLAGCMEEVERTDANIKFIPAEMKWFHNIRINGAQYFHLITKGENDYPDFSDDIPNYIVNSSTVVFSAVQIAAYMGIKEIYLLGIDHHFHTSVNNKGQIVIDKTAKDYFCDNYNSDKDKLYIPNTEKSTLTYVAMKEHCEKREIRVYNATRGGKLEVFQRVNFDMLF